ncbi:cytochrome P450 [Sistotremastrum suecicum HHB10207 ss-3]|uniref:Cytochrome P450 n=1 Tax=Sistotremastrum suecicum HHB10207 ss-3 TaxID=1314776 RepID=A0A166J7G8_9AGAM|nr:cytochrome P450 [Sistotremastrum suecicum HHB10207 ss-3]
MLSLIWKIFLLGVGVQLWSLARTWILKAPQTRPQVVFSWLPWIGSSIAYGRNPIVFLLDCQKRYGPIFTLILWGKPTTFITTSSSIKAVQKNASALSEAERRVFLGETVYGIPAHIANDGRIIGEVLAYSSRNLTKHSVEKMSVNLGPLIWDILHSMTKNESTSDTPTAFRLKEFIFGSMYASFATYLFGPLFPVGETFEDYLLFHDSFELFTENAPDSTLEPSLNARNRVTKAIHDYVKQNWTGKAIPGCSDWISTLILRLKELGCHNDEIAPILLAVLTTTASDVMWTVYWFWVFQFQDPAARKSLESEAEIALSSSLRGKASKLREVKASYFDGDNFTLHESAFYETLRRANDTALFYDVVQDITVEDAETNYRVVLLKGDKIAATPQVANYDPFFHSDPIQWKLDRFTSTLPVNAAEHMLGVGSSLFQTRHLNSYFFKAFSVICHSCLELHREHALDAQGHPITDPLAPQQTTKHWGIARTDANIMISVRSRTAA